MSSIYGDNIFESTNINLLYDEFIESSKLFNDFILSINESRLQAPIRIARNAVDFIIDKVETFLKWVKETVLKLWDKIMSKLSSSYRIKKAAKLEREKAEDEYNEFLEKVVDVWVPKDDEFNQAFSILNNEKNLIKFKRFTNDEFAGINIDDKNIDLFGKIDSQIYVFIDYSYQINNEYKKYEAATNKILNNLKAKKNELEHDNSNDEHTKELIKSLEVNLYNANLLINMITEYLTKYSNLDSKINIKLHELNPNGFDFERFHFSKFSYDKFDPDED